MSDTDKKPRGGKADQISERLQLAAIGMEAEFALVVDEQPVRPEDVFGDPRAFIRGPLLHRTGTSYHLPTGGIVYFDTGVIEVATPVIELERGCAARAGRSLWEGILYLRRELDDWQTRQRREARLVGFSTHYNVSFHAPTVEAGEASVAAERRTVQQLALLLTYLLPAPVMLLATNRESTGVGVRPRGDRIEVTADFTPSSSLMIAAATVITGIIREASTWPDYTLEALAERGIPVIEGFSPCAHTSRKGWLARFNCFPENPFVSNASEAKWPVRLNGRLTHWSLRRLARRIFVEFSKSISAIA